jgi:hypothetical protein
MYLLDLIKKYGETNYKKGIHIGELTLQKKFEKKQKKLFNRIEKEIKRIC